ncbi:MAG: hypothetical protein JSS66_04865 [Armatimonadetes bacterium]|nr:hypothetical protein [Armatimonadota bacterium]
MASASFKPKELRGQCMLGAILLPRPGTVGGTHAQGFVQDEETRTISRNFITSMRNPHPGRPSTAEELIISMRLNSIPNCSGGIIPYANMNIGAPMCTFAEGGIPAGEVSAYYDLIKGPDAASLTYDNQKYDPSYDSEATVSSAVTGDYDDAEAFDTTQVVGVPNPTLPPAYKSVFDSLGADKPVARHTYNVWRRITPESIDGTKTIKNQGPTGDNFAQLPGDNSMFVEVHGNCTLKRLFPISKDYLYTGNVDDAAVAEEDKAVLVYPADRLFKVSTRRVQMASSPNCGFQMHFWHGRPRTNVITENNDAFDGSIVLEWGDENAGDAEDLVTVSRFRLTLTVNQQPKFEYFHPRSREFEAFSIVGPIFAQGQNESQYSVFVHFAGSVMLIGFEPNPLTWNCFSPPLSDERIDDENTQFPPYISTDATIKATFRYIATKFQYGPIAFNNYHPELITADGLNDGIEDLGFVRANFTAPAAKSDTIDPTALNEFFQAHRLRQPRTSEEETALEAAPTYYADWRRRTQEQAQELIYYGTLSVPTDDQLTAEPRSEAECKGIVSFNTTLEGPVFFYVKPPGPAKVPEPLVKQFVKWGDMSNYLSEWTVTYSLMNDNASRVHGKAQVVLLNLAATQMGRKVLAFIEENKPTVTLGGGYGAPTTFFQGQVLEVTTQRRADGTSVTTLECEDIASVLVDRLTFRKTEYFAGVRYNDIIRSCMEHTGLIDWYKEQEAVIGHTDDPEQDELGLAAFRNALEIRLASTSNHPSLSTPTITGDPAESISEVIDPILDLIIDLNVLPVLYWDYNKGYIRLDWRFDNAFVDALEFVGTPDENNVTFLPNVSAEFQHGVLMGDYVETTMTDFLYTDFLVYGKTPYGEPIGAVEPEDRNSAAYSQATLDLINRSFENNEPLPEDIGYVGYPKWYVEVDKQSSLLTKEAIRRRVQTLHDVRRKTYQTINFSCYVTKPLRHNGRFYLKTFVGQNTAINTDMYFYREVSYNFKKEENIITASIQGETFPVITANALVNLGPGGA